MNDDCLIIIGRNIRRLRIDHGWTQEELASKCGYESATRKSTINKIEAGKSNLPASKILEIAKALGVPASTLFGESDSKPHSIDLNDSEMDLILAYRQADDLTKQMVLRILGIEESTVEESAV